MGWYQDIVRDPNFKKSKWGMRFGGVFDRIDNIHSATGNNRHRKIRQFGIKTFKDVYGWLRKPKRPVANPSSVVFGFPVGHQSPSSNAQPQMNFQSPPNKMASSPYLINYNQKEKIEIYTNGFKKIMDKFTNGAYVLNNLSENQIRTLHQLHQSRKKLMEKSRRFDNSVEAEAKEFAANVERFNDTLKRQFNNNTMNNASVSNALKTIGVTRNNTKTNAKKKYRKLAMNLHPNKGGNENEFKKIQHAWEQLKNIDDKDWNAIKGRSEFY